SHYQCNELRRRKQSAEYEASIGIASECFQNKSSHGVQERVREDHFAIEAFAAAQLHEHDEENEACSRLVQLNGMKRHPARRTTDRRGVGIGDRDGPRHLRGASKIITCHETSDPADRLTERDRGCTYVGRLPEGKLGVSAEEDRREDQCADEAAVE